MKDLVLGFIGAGNMNTAILSGVLRKQMFPPERIWLSNRHAESSLLSPNWESAPRRITARLPGTRIF